MPLLPNIFPSLPSFNLDSEDVGVKTARKKAKTMEEKTKENWIKDKTVTLMLVTKQWDL